MKPIVTYCGGKQRMVPFILPIIPEHKTYVEPFCGGAALFFAKQLAKVNVLNDINGNLISIYRAYADPRIAGRLIRRLEFLPQSEELYKEAKTKLLEEDLIVEDRAFYSFILYNQSFGGIVGGGYAHSRDNTESSRNKSKTARERIITQINHLKNCKIFQRDAGYLIDFYDAPDTLFYLDPPYINTTQKYNNKKKVYTIEDLANLANKIKTVKGKVIISHYVTDDVKEIFNFLDIHTKVTKQTLNKKSFSQARLEGVWTNFKTNPRTLDKCCL